MIYRPIRTPEDLVMLQSDIDSLTCWTDQSFLQFNADKCKYTVISRKRQINLSLESQSPLQINGVAMERVDDYKYLGVWITSNLSWSKHISEVCHKARQKVGILHHKRYRSTNNATVLKLYLAYTRYSVSTAGKDSHATTVRESLALRAWKFPTATLKCICSDPCTDVLKVVSILWL